jgi:hypothetical protein
MPPHAHFSCLGFAVVNERGLPMSGATLIKKQAEAFVEAENDGNADAADTILSQDFICITRSNGDEENREQLLTKIKAAAADKNNPLRRLDFTGACSGIWMVGNACWIARGIVSTSKREKPDVVDGRYRNTYIFKRDDDGLQSESWRLLTLQVTRLPTN